MAAYAGIGKILNFPLRNGSAIATASPMTRATQLLTAIILGLMFSGCASSSLAPNQESTFLFWAPKSPKLPDIAKNLSSLNSELNSKCGGFSRWVIDGGWRDSESKKDLSLPGYFYLITCKNMKSVELAGLIRKTFDSNEAYILELPAHRFTE